MAKKTIAQMTTEELRIALVTALTQDFPPSVKVNAYIRVDYLTKTSKEA